MSQEDMDQAIKALGVEDGNRDYIVIAHPIDRHLHWKLSDLLHRQYPESQSSEKKKAVTVFLTTYGGDPDGGYRVARCLRHYYKGELRVAVPSFCKSAGTLIAIAADVLAIGDRGELGPLDVQVVKGTELQERSSGLDITEALGLVTQQVHWSYNHMLRHARGLRLSTKLAAEMAAHISSAIAQPLLSQVDPMRGGELQRAVRIATEYGKRLNAYSLNLKGEALQALVHDYPSHSFVIDRKESGELFERVTGFTQAEQGFVDNFWWQLHEPSNIVDLLEVSEPTAEFQTGQTHHGNNDETCGATESTLAGCSQVKRNRSEDGRSSPSGESLSFCAKHDGKKASGESTRRLRAGQSPSS